jgi:serine/threonine protein kinase
MHSYEQGKVLGKGAFSTVVLATNRETNKKWAGDEIFFSM